jgi:hypothetical protein
MGGGVATVGRSTLSERDGAVAKHGQTIKSRIEKGDNNSNASYIEQDALYTLLNGPRETVWLRGLLRVQGDEAKQK